MHSFILFFRGQVLLLYMYLIGNAWTQYLLNLYDNELDLGSLLFINSDLEVVSLKGVKGTWKKNMATAFLHNKELYALYLAYMSTTNTQIFVDH